MEEYKKVQEVIYDGTIESYNEFIDKLFSDSANYHINFLDNNLNSTYKFTGIFRVYPDGIIYRPGDAYIYDID